MPWRMAFPTLIPTTVSSWNLWGRDSGKLRAAVRAVTDRDSGGLYAPEKISALRQVAGCWTSSARSTRMLASPRNTPSTLTPTVWNCFR